MWFCIPLPSRKSKDQRAKAGKTPTPAPKAPEHEFAEVQKKLEDELREARGLLETREKDLADRDASLQRLEKAMGEIQAKVGRVETRMELSIADMICKISRKGCYPTISGFARSRADRPVGREG